MQPPKVDKEWKNVPLEGQAVQNANGTYSKNGSVIRRITAVMATGGKQAVSLYVNNVF